MFTLENMLCFESSEAMKRSLLIPNSSEGSVKLFAAHINIFMLENAAQRYVAPKTEREVFQLSGLHTCACASVPATRQTGAVALTLKIHWRRTISGNTCHSGLETHGGASGIQAISATFWQMSDWSSNWNAMLSTYSRMLHQSEDMDDFHLQKGKSKA